MNFISFKNIDIKEGFWQDRQRLNSDVTIHAVRDRFVDTGRFEAFKFNWEQGKPNEPHIFWDSDVAKWLEGAAYILQKEPNPLLEAQADELVELIAEHQEADGYFNIYYTVVEPGKRFTRRENHELYCAGHLIEAAVAYYEATGKDKLLKCMCRYADLIEKVFKIDGSAAFITPGHEEIELALVKLYKCTGEKRYLELSKFFIDKRGCSEEMLGYDFAKQEYFQSHKPCREQLTAQGHSVRACYLYSGMADIAAEYSDSELLNACEKIFDDIYYKKMYVTAGIGQSLHGEAFTVPYDLRNDTAYTETCAAISLAYFAHRMQSLKLDSRFGDVIERAIYNGILSGISIDGKSFFYENPLEILLSEHGRNVSVKECERYPITHRLEVFDCSCCPPNLARFIASIGDYIYGYDDETLYVHQFISSETQLDGAKIKLTSGFPYDGNIKIEVKDFNKSVAIRIPSYTKDNFSITVNGKAAEYELKNGYAFVKLDADSVIDLSFDLTPKKVFANPLVDRDAGKCAIVAGPIVYCAEGVDNGNHLRRFRIPEKLEYSFVDNGELGTKDIVIKAEKKEDTEELYSFSEKYTSTQLRLIPYFAFANRGDNDMAVWLVTG